MMKKSFFFLLFTLCGFFSTISAADVGISNSMIEYSGGIASQTLQISNNESTDISGFTITIETSDNIVVSGFDYSGNVYSSHYTDTLTGYTYLPIIITYTNLPSSGSQRTTYKSLTLDTEINTSFFTNSYENSYTPSEFVDFGIGSSINTYIFHPGDIVSIAVYINNYLPNSTLTGATGTATITIPNEILITDRGSGIVSTNNNIGIYEVPFVENFQAPYIIYLTGTIDSSIMGLNYLSLIGKVSPSIYDINTNNNTTYNNLTIEPHGIDLYGYLNTSYSGNTIVGYITIGNNSSTGTSGPITYTAQLTSGVILSGDGWTVGVDNTYTKIYTNIINGYTFMEDTIEFISTNLTGGDQFTFLSITSGSDTDYNTTNNSFEYYLTIPSNLIDLEIFINPVQNIYPLLGSSVLRKISGGNFQNNGAISYNTQIDIEVPTGVQVNGYGNGTYPYTVSGNHITYTLGSLNGGSYNNPITLSLTGINAEGQYTITGTIIGSGNELNTGNNIFVQQFQRIIPTRDGSIYNRIQYTSGSLYPTTHIMLGAGYIGITGIVEFSVSSGVIPIASGLVSLGNNRYRLGEIFTLNAQDNIQYNNLSFDTSAIPPATERSFTTEFIVANDTYTGNNKSIITLFSPSNFVDVYSRMQTSSRFINSDEVFVIRPIAGNYFDGSTQTATGVYYTIEYDPMIVITDGLSGWDYVSPGKYEFFIGDIVSDIGIMPENNWMSTINGFLSSQAITGHTYTITGTIRTSSREYIGSWNGYNSNNTSFIEFYKKSSLADLVATIGQYEFTYGSGGIEKNVVRAFNQGGSPATGYTITITSPSNLITFSGDNIVKSGNHYIINSNNIFDIQSYLSLADMYVASGIVVGSYTGSITIESLSPEDALLNNTNQWTITIIGSGVSSSGLITPSPTNPITVGFGGGGGFVARPTYNVSGSIVSQSGTYTNLSQTLSLTDLQKKYKSNKAVSLLLYTFEKKVQKTKNKVTKNRLLKKLKSTVTYRSTHNKNKTTIYKELLQDLNRLAI